MSKLVHIFDALIFRRSIFCFLKNSSLKKSCHEFSPYQIHQKGKVPRERGCWNGYCQIYLWSVIVLQKTDNFSRVF